jgi:selenocysteine-specific elongation factor
VVDQYVLTRPGWQRLLERMARALADYHRQYPLRTGMPREELRSRLKLAPAAFNPLVAGAAAVGSLVEAGALLRLPGHTIRFTAVQQAQIDRLLRQFSQAGVNSPSVKEAITAVGDDVYAALLELNSLYQISADVVYLPETYEFLAGQIVAYLRDVGRSHGRINAAQARDMFGASRKYTIAILEQLDATRITRRVGDDRELNPAGFEITQY